jgi:hypothetical protein
MSLERYFTRLIGHVRSSADYSPVLLAAANNRNLGRLVLEEGEVFGSHGEENG